MTRVHSPFGVSDSARRLGRWFSQKSSVSDTVDQASYDEANGVLSLRLKMKELVAEQGDIFPDPRLSFATLNILSGYAEGANDMQEIKMAHKVYREKAMNGRNLVVYYPDFSSVRVLT